MVVSAVAHPARRLGTAVSRPTGAGCVLRRGDFYLFFYNGEEKKRWTGEGVLKRRGA